MNKVHNFNEQLQFSRGQIKEYWWEEIYFKAFPTLKSVVEITEDGWAQRAGIDRLIILNSGKQIYVDEKVRRNNYGDILLEYWSDEEKQRPGWIAKDLATDFIAYAIVPIRECYLLPFHTLRRAWKENRFNWVRNYKEVRAQNRGYVTVSVAIPTDILLKSLQDAMKIKWDAQSF